MEAKELSYKELEKVTGAFGPTNGWFFICSACNTYLGEAQFDWEIDRKLESYKRNHVCSSPKGPKIDVQVKV